MIKASDGKVTSWTPGSRGEVTSGDCVCLNSRDVLTKRQNYWRQIQTQAAFCVLKWAASSALPLGRPGEGDKDFRLSSPRGTFDHLGMASSTPPIPEIALGSSQPVARGWRGFRALIP